ncbi:MAG: hypothetical protein IPN87_17115 [Saprospiraceae bacterium]|nr:hypothetical protein [Candidatus Brachybacter algidus]
MNTKILPDQMMLNGSVIITLTTGTSDGIGPCNPASNTMKMRPINTPPVIVFQSVAHLVGRFTCYANSQSHRSIFTGNGISGNQFDPTVAGVGTHKIFYKANVGTFAFQ